MRRSSMVSPETLRILLNIVDDAILRHLYQEDIDISDTERCSRALLLAAHIFMYVTLRQVPPKSPLLRRMCTRLQSTVRSTAFAEEIWRGNEVALLWIAFVGLLGMGEEIGASLEGQWFLNVFRSTFQRQSQDFSTQNGSLCGMLSTFLWDDPYCQPLLARLEAHLGTHVP